MNKPFQNLLLELERFGEQNDKSTPERSRKMLNITHDTGIFISILIRAASTRRILEIGTSNGYSTLWLADAAREIGGKVTTIEHSDYKAKLAYQNFQRGGLTDYIDLVQTEAGCFLQLLSGDAFDFIFLDSERSEYPGWLPHIRRALRCGGLLVVDNAISHKEEIAPFNDMLRLEQDFTVSIVPIGNGELLAFKSNAK